MLDFALGNLLGQVCRVGRITSVDAIGGVARKIVGGAMRRPSSSGRKVRAIAGVARRQAEAFYCPWAGSHQASVPQEGFLAAGSHQGICNELCD